MEFPHWDYLATIGEDLEETARYVEPVEENFKSFSVEFVRLCLAIGSEVDVVAKLVCEKVNPGCTVKNIDDYRGVICAAYPGLPEVKVAITRSNNAIQPWLDWKSGKNPTWWKSYNGVKHERNRFFAEANLGNAILSFGGLLILTGYLYGEALERHVFVSPSKFVKFSREYYSGHAMGEHFTVGYCLPGFTRKPGQPYRP